MLQILSCLLSITLINASDLVTFWHVSDFHLDLNYSDIGDTYFNCHSNSPNDVNLPKFGFSTNVRCDTPYIMAESAIKAMKEFESQPDFIIWTGDSAPHLDDSVVTEQWVIDTLSNLTNLIRSYFPTSKLYSVLGNHDYWPSNQFPPNPTGIYQSAADLWGKDLSSEASTNLSRFGYYRQDLDKPKGTILLGLNTNLNYQYNLRTEDVEDPAGQFAFMESTLEEAKLTKKRVLLISHIPPGYKSLSERHNQRLVKLLAQYSDIIIGSYFGHNHVDQFMLVRKESNDEFISWVLATPAVNTWMGSGRNPAIRLISIDSVSGDIRQLKQYYLNLREANLGNVKWTNNYSVNLTANVTFLQYLIQIYEDLKSGDPHSMLAYLKRENVESNEVQFCDETCRRVELCGISELMYDRYLQCASISSNLLSSNSVIIYTLVINFLMMQTVLAHLTFAKL